MKSKKRLWIILVIVWISYFVWEFFVQKWSESELTAVIRVDLILIIPILIFVTSLVLYKNLKNT